MSRVSELFIRPLTAVMQVKAAEPKVLFADIETALQGYPDAVLQRAAERIRRQRPKDGFYRDAATFPTTAECIEWCAAEMPRYTPKPIADDMDTAAADEAIQSELGARAVREGWIVALWDHYAREGRDPTSQEIAGMQRAAAAADADMGRTDTASKIFNRARIARRDRLVALVMGADA
ncbi:MAG: hypothetical protein AAFQ35_12770 [Pseudomonadota bacterium]